MADLVPATRDRILEAALLAMGRVGVRRLTMNDISERAGLSRGTVYRYFPSKDDLLAVVAEYEQDRFAGGLRAALADLPEEELRLERVAEYLITYLRCHPALTLMIDIEPAFVLGFWGRQLPVFRQIAEELLAPIMRQTRPVREGWLTVPELSELLLRVVLSVFLVPGESSIEMVGVLEGALDSFVRLASAGARPSAGLDAGATPSVRARRPAGPSTGAAKPPPPKRRRSS
jgi:AcrR family transcriptional regulator